MKKINRIETVPGYFPDEQDPRRCCVARGLARLDARRDVVIIVVIIIITNMVCHDRTELWVSSGVTNYTIHNLDELHTNLALSSTRLGPAGYVSQKYGMVRPRDA